MSVQSVSSKASRLLTGRAIHLKIEPRTRNIRQSQEIYRFLKKFGEVDSFRNLRVRDIHSDNSSSKNPRAADFPARGPQSNKETRLVRPNRPLTKHHHRHLPKSRSRQ